jgi:hypothetical protein
MAHSDFSWRKLLSFIGAAVLVFVAFVTISTGANVIYNGHIFNGVMTCFGGASAIVLAVILYKDYQKWADENKSAKNKLY